MIAVSRKDGEALVSLLLNKGADVNETSKICSFLGLLNAKFILSQTISARSVQYKSATLIYRLMGNRRLFSSQPPRTTLMLPKSCLQTSRRRQRESRTSVANTPFTELELLDQCPWLSFY